MLVREKLEQDLRNYKRLVLISSSFGRRYEVLGLLKRKAYMHIYCPFEIPNDYSNVEHISLEQEKEMLDFYYMYEFTDRFAVVNNIQPYGSVWNYVATGLLTIEEAVEAMGIDGS